MAAYTAVGALLHCHHFGEGLKAEDSHWIRGDYFGTPLRLPQHLLLHRVCFPLFGDNLDAYYVLTLGLHVINAGLVCALYVSLARGMNGPRPLLGGALAGLLMLCYDRNNLGYVSAVSYQLVVLFLLCGTLAVVTFVQRERAWTWGLAVLSYGAALWTNVFALAFPVFWILLEGALRNQDSVALTSQRSRHARTALMMVPLALLLWQHGAFLWGYDGVQAVRAESLWQNIAQLPVYLGHVVASSFSGLTGVDLAPDVPAWLAALPVLALTAWAAWQTYFRSRPGWAAVATLFVVVWNGLVLLQALAARDDFSGDWRYYFGAAGISLAAAWLAMDLLVRAGVALGGLWGRAVEVGGAAVIMVALVAVNPGLRRLFEPDATPSRPAHGGQASQCVELVKVERGQAAALAVRGANLRCRDLLWADLDGVNLTGAVLQEANLFGASLRRARLDGAHLGSARLVAARLQDAVLRKAKLMDADLSGGRLAGADLSGADLSRALLIKCDLRGSSLRGANLRRADLMEADLRGARLEGAILDGALLQGAAICRRSRGAIKGYRGSPRWVPCSR